MNLTMEVDAVNEMEDILLRDDQTGLTQCYDELFAQQQHKIQELLKENLEQKRILKKQEEEKEQLLKWQNENNFNASGPLSKPLGNVFSNNHQQPPALPPRNTNSDGYMSQSTGFSASCVNQQPPPLPPRTFKRNLQLQSSLKTLMPHNNLLCKTQQPPPIPPRTSSLGIQGRQKSDAMFGSSTNPFLQPQQSTSILTWNATLDQQKSKPFDGFDKPRNPFAPINQPPLTLTNESNTNFNGQRSTKTSASSNPFTQHESSTWMYNTPQCVSPHQNSPVFAELTASTQVPQGSYFGQNDTGVNNGFYQMDALINSSDKYNPTLHRQTTENTETNEERISTSAPFNQNNNSLNSSASKNIMLPYNSWLKKHNMKENRTFRGKRGGNPQKRQFFAEKFSKKNIMTNKTLENVASYHLSLAKGAMEEKSFKKKPNFKRRTQNQ